MGVHLNDKPDSFKWRLTTTIVYMVKSMYVDYMNEHTIFLTKYMWKITVSQKIRIFMWFFYKNMLQPKIILQKDVGWVALNVSFVIHNKHLIIFHHLSFFLV
jgi:hypothetical protein